MFFPRLGQFVRRRWAWLLLAWLALLGGTWAAAPPWDAVAQDRQFAFLPADAPSRRAQEMFERAFPEDRLASSVVLVLHRSGDGPGRLEADLKFIEDVVEPRLRRLVEEAGGFANAPADTPLFGDAPAAPLRPRSIIDRLRTPNAPGAGGLLVSADGRAMLVLVELTTEFLDSANWPIVDRVERLARQLKAEGRLPAGLEVAVTGSAVIGRDHTQAQLQSARATEVLTVVLVVVLLVLIYRAPLLAVIPLLTVVLAVQIALHCLSLLAGAGYMTLFQGIQIYITILAYGAGVDYCLFLVARYREELEQGARPDEAIARAVGGVGAALAASAATVIFGVGMMYFAEFGKFRQAGLAIPFALLLVLAANLTFTPSLLRLAGRWAFWPGRPEALPAQAAHPQRGWERLGELLLRRPGTLWLATAACMAPFAVVAGLNYDRLSYNLIGVLPEGSPSLAGTRVLQRHFPAGMVGATSVLLVNPAVDFRAARGRAAVAGLTESLRERRDELGLTDVRSLTAPLGITPAAADPDWGIDVPADVRREAVEKMAQRRYVTDLGERDDVGTRLDVVLAHDPFSHAALGAVTRLESAIREALPAELRDGTQVFVSGTTASVRDLAAVMQRDRLRIEVLVLLSVLAVLFVLLRRAVLSVYLLLSVLFSYYTTLGVSFVVFTLLDPQGFQGIDWKVAIFLFTILIAVGEDYNILLITRVDEESVRLGPRQGVVAAVVRTGPIITSCGVIMAGTFGALLGGSLAELKQLGFALAFGVLLDTFVVRPILVPAFLLLLHAREPRRVERPPEPQPRGAAPPFGQVVSQP